MCRVVKIHYEHVQSHETQTVIAQQTNIHVYRKAVRTFFKKNMEWKSEKICSPGEISCLVVDWGMKCNSGSAFSSMFRKWNNKMISEELMDCAILYSYLFFILFILFSHMIRINTTSSTCAICMSRRKMAASNITKIGELIVREKFAKHQVMFVSC